MTKSPSIRWVTKIGSIFGAMALLTACISDGPNRTGGQFLSNQDIRFQTPLYHVVLPDFPIDSAWTIDMDQSHFSDSILMLGYDGDFNAQARMAFDISDTNFLDSLGDTASFFRLSLGTYISSGSGMDELRRSVGNGPDSTSGTYKDSLTVLVEAWAIADTNANGDKLSTTQRTDSLNLYNRRFLQRQDTTAVLPEVTSRDTIRIRLKDAYSTEKLQTSVLPNLWQALHSMPTSSKVLVQLQLTALPDTLPGPAMLRLDCRYNSISLPALLFGSPASVSSAKAKQRIAPIFSGSYYWVNYVLRYAGSDINIVPAKKRYLHMQINRSVLLDKIKEALQDQGYPVPASAINGNFDLTYFLPFGKISVPVDPANMQGQFPMEFYLQSDLDSLIPGSPPNSMSIKEFTLEKKAILVTIRDHNDPEKIADSISVEYQKAKSTSEESELRKIIITYAKDSARNDTSIVKPGDTRTKAIGGGLGNPALQLTLMADSNSVQVGYYLASGIVTEANEFRDSESGELLTTLAERLPKLFYANQDNVTLRATHGLQALLNRADAGKNVFPDLVLIPSQAVDTTASVSGSTQPQYIPYSTLSVIPISHTSGELRVTLDLYLSPLKKGL